MTDQPLGPFTVTPKQVTRLETAFTPFVNELLRREVASAKLSGGRITTTYQENVGDEGVDAGLTHAIETRYIPSGPSAWQFKRGDLAPAACKKELKKASAALEILHSGGKYRLVIGKDINYAMVKRRRNALREQAEALGIELRNGTIEVLNASDLAEWAQQHPSLAISHLLGGIGSYVEDIDEWAASAGAFTSWVQSDACKIVAERVRETIEGKEPPLHIEGVKGVGKSRTVLEAVRGKPYESLVVYARNAENFPPNMIRYLHGEGRRAVLIVDDCDPNQHKNLAEAIPVGSGLRLITIGEPAPSRVEHPTLELPKMEQHRIAEILLRNRPGISPEDASSVADIADGNVRRALLLADKVVRKPRASAGRLIPRDIIETYVAAGAFDVAQPKLEDLLQPTMDEIDAIASNVGLARGVPTGFAELDDVTNGLHPGQLIIVAARPGVGKALALDTPLPTPAGWATMGSVAVGDELLGADRQPTRVVAATDVMLGRPCYEIEFSDGTVIVADADHQWPTGYGVRTTVELRCGLDSIAAAESIARYAERRATATLMAPVLQLDAVRRVRSVPVRCVQVDNAAHLYLAGRGMVPTHNSTLGLDFVRSCSIRHRLASVIFSLEMRKSEIVTRLLSAEAKIKLSDMRSGRMSDDDWVRLARRMSEISEAPLYIDDSPNLTMMEIRAKARRLRQKADLKLIVVDYLQLMSSGERFESRQQEVSEFSRDLKLLARELDVPVVAISQLNRGPEQRIDRKPMLADLGESCAIEQDSDLVILLHRPDAFEWDDPRAGEADLIIAKHRNGPTKIVTVAHQLHLSRFANMAR